MNKQEQIIWKKQMHNMSSVHMPTSIPPSGDDIPFEEESLSRRF